MQMLEILKKKQLWDAVSAVNMRFFIMQLENRNACRFCGKSGACKPIHTCTSVFLLCSRQTKHFRGFEWTTLFL